MEFNFTLIGSYLVVIVFTIIIPITTNLAGILGIPIALLTKNSKASKIIGYTCVWMGIAWLWNYINDRPFPLLISIIILLILSNQFVHDRSLNVDGREMINAERLSIIIVSVVSPLIFGFSWFK